MKANIVREMIAEDREHRHGVLSNKDYSDSQKRAIRMLKGIHKIEYAHSMQGLAPTREMVRA